MRNLSAETVGLILTSSVTLIAGLYHLVVRQVRADNIKQGLTLELRSFRENNNQRFDRVELRLASIEGQLAGIQERHATNERWQGAVDTRLQAQEGRIARLERAGAV